MSLLSALLLLTAGCGGEGGGTQTGRSGDSSLSLFFTSEKSEDFDQVWMTAYKVELLNDSERVTLFEDSQGQTIDLASLSGPTANEFLFAGQADVPKGTYTKVLLTASRETQLFSKGEESGQATLFPAEMNDGERTKIEVILDPPMAVTNPGQDLVISFPLAEWKLEAGSVSPLIKRHVNDGLEDLNRHRVQSYRGVVGSLTGTAPEQTFVLSMSGRRVQVICQPGLRISSDLPEGENAPLADGRLIEASGVFDVLTRSLRAQAVFIPSGPVQQGEANLSGQVQKSDESVGTIMTQPSTVHGFSPGSRSVKTLVSDATKFLKADGKAATRSDFFSALSADKTLVEILGTWKSEDAVLSAASVRLIDSSPILEASAAGVIKTANKEEGQLILLAEGIAMLGFAPPEGVEVRLKALNTTVFRDAGGSPLTKDQFFEKALAGVKIKGSGSQNDGQISCRLLEIVEIQPPHEDK